MTPSLCACQVKVIMLRSVAGDYEQFCAVARTLDVVGDRWTLLIARELLTGPRRYRDLQHDLPGIATNLLAARLRRLEAEGLVEASPMEDSRRKVYALTPTGQRLRPVLESLAIFGLSNLMSGPAPDGAAFRAHWLEIPVRAILVPGALTDDLVVRFEVEGADDPASASPLQLRLGPGGARRDDDNSEADVVVAGDADALLASVRHPASLPVLLQEGRLRVEGTDRDLARLSSALRLPEAHIAG